MKMILLRCVVAMLTRVNIKEVIPNEFFDHLRSLQNCQSSKGFATPRKWDYKLIFQFFTLAVVNMRNFHMSWETSRLQCPDFLSNFTDLNAF